MNDDRSSLANRAATPEEAARESRHEVLRELLGAYADRELPPETVAQIDAHLVGCAECRRGLEVHHSLRARLAVEPPAAASPAFRARILAESFDGPARARRIERWDRMYPFVDPPEYEPKAENSIAAPVGVDVGLPVGPKVGLGVGVGVPLGVAVGSVAFHLQMTPSSPEPPAGRLQPQFSGLGWATANIALSWFTEISQLEQGWPGVQAFGPWYWLLNP